MMHYTPFAVSNLVSMVVLLGFSVHAFVHARQPVLLRTGVVLLSGALWSLCNALGLFWTDLGGKIVFQLLQIPCVSVILLLILFSVMESNGTAAWRAPRRAWLFLIEPLAALILGFAARGTTLFMYDFRLAADGASPGLLFTRGPLGWAHVVYSYVIVTVSVVSLILRQREAPVRQRWQGILIISAILIPALSFLVFLLGAAPLPGINVAPVTQTLGTLCLAGALFILPFGTVMPVAGSVIVRTMEDLVLVVDGKERLVSANPSARAAIGVDPSRGIALDALPAPWRTALGPWWGASSARETVRVELPGRTRWYHLTVTPLRDDTVGRPRDRLLLLHDVTERTEAEEELRRSEDQLRESQKMEAIGRLAGGVAHDYNNLLTVITGYCDLLDEELAENSSQKRQVAEIARAARRASALTAQLLVFGGRRRARPRLIEINSLAQGLEERIRGVLGDRIRLTMDLLADGGFIMADPEQIEQAIINLAMNAREAMPEGGDLVFVTARSRVERLRDHPEVAPGDYVTVAMSDTGTGMSDQIVSRIFEPFFTTKETGKGPGLGLPTTYGIVKHSGGYIYCSSTPGKGTTFLLYFPCTTASGLVTAAAP
jgi:signal transduction histidine kinase